MTLSQSLFAEGLQLIGIKLAVSAHKPHAFLEISLSLPSLLEPFLHRYLHGLLKYLSRFFCGLLQLSGLG